MARKFYTIDDLYNFCKENHYETFSAEKQGAPLIVQSIGTFETTDNITDGLMAVKLKSCHTGKNRNKSGISDETMELYKDSFKGRPILGAIYKTDTGEYEFRAHDMEVVADGDDVDINYIEQPIGVISQTTTPYLEYDEDAKKNYLMVEGTIFTDYSKAAEILERRRTCKCSVEIAVEEMSYNCSEDYLSIDKFHFTGVTILGYQQDGTTEIQEGMAGSKITIDDFSAKHNSIFTIDYQDKMIEVLDRLDKTLSNFNKYSEEKGGVEMTKFEELLVKYGKTEEDITFETEGLSDDELEEKFKEVFEDDNDESKLDGDDESDSENDDGDNSDDEDEPITTEEEACGKKKKKKKCSIDENGNMSVSFEISHEDIRGALFNLIGVYEEEDNEWYWITNVYDDYFIFENWDGNKLYKQSYSVDGDNVALSGDRQEVFKMILTESEKLAIEKMRDDYASLETKYNELRIFKDNYDSAEIKAKKDAIFSRDEYSVLSDDDEFNALVSEADKFSVEDIESKAKAIFADYVIKNGTFNSKNNDSKKPKVITFSFKPEKESKKKPYGNLFSDK